MHGYIKYMKKNIQVVKEQEIKKNASIWWFYIYNCTYICASVHTYIYIYLHLYINVYILIKEKKVLFGKRKMNCAMATLKISWRYNFHKISYISIMYVHFQSLFFNSLSKIYIIDPKDFGKLRITMTLTKDIID